jgi:hypothetical protein
MSFSKRVPAKLLLLVVLPLQVHHPQKRSNELRHQIIYPCKV